MQRIINFLAFTSFCVSAGMVGAGTYVYLNKDALIEQAKEEAIKSLTESLGGGLPSVLLGGPADPVAGMDESGAVPLPVIPF